MITYSNFIMSASPNPAQGFIDNLIIPIMFVVALMFILVFIKNRQWMKAVAFLGIASVTMALTALGPGLSATKNKTSGNKSAKPTPTPHTTNNNTHDSHVNIDYSLLLAILGGIVALIIVAGLAYIVKEYAKGKKAIINANNEQKLAEFKRLAELDKQLTAEWNDLIVKHTNILDEWNAYDKDIKKLLELPAMRNFALPEVGAVIDALDAAADAKTLKYPRGIESIQGTDYYKAVKNCEKVFDEAMHVAINHKNKVMPSKERKQLALANQLLRTAMNESASSNERQLAYSRIMTIMEDLRIEVPKGVVRQIEDRTRLLLEA